MLRRANRKPCYWGEYGSLGIGTTYPSPEDEHVYLLWEWEDCCLPII